MFKSSVTSVDVEGGVTLTVKPDGAAQLDALRKETRERLAEQVANALGHGKMVHCPSAVDGAATKVSDIKDGVILVVTGKGETIDASGCAPPSSSPRRSRLKRPSVTRGTAKAAVASAAAPSSSRTPSSRRKTSTAARRSRCRRSTRSPWSDLQRKRESAPLDSPPEPPMTRSLLLLAALWALVHSAACTQIPLRLSDAGPALAPVDASVPAASTPDAGGTDADGDDDDDDDDDAAAAGGGGGGGGTGAGGGTGSGGGGGGGKGPPKRLKAPIVHLDGVPIGVMRFGELPPTLATTWLPVEGLDKPVRRFKLVDYFKALGVDVKKLRAAHLYSGRGRVAVITGDDLRNKEIAVN